MKKEEIERAASVKYPHPQIVDMQAAGHQGFTEGAEWAKQEMIEKAKKAFCNSSKCGVPIDTCLSLGTCDAYDRFKKILEE